MAEDNHTPLPGALPAASYAPPEAPPESYAEPAESYAPPTSDVAPPAAKSPVATLHDNVHAMVRRVVIGQTEVVDHLLVALLAGGHVLLEGVPGTAKTLLCKTFSAALSLDFNRIQFTPDLMPGDVIGTNIFNFQSSEFTLTKGPVFTEFLLADEINRTPPKTQAALLQAMQERLVTIDGKTYNLGDDFTVVATQNPVEQEGTYPLPEAQLDRFLLKVEVGYPTRDQERELVKMHGHRTKSIDVGAMGVTPVATHADLAACRAIVSGVIVSDDMVDYIVDIVRATRQNQGFICGASPRAANMLARAARARAALDGRDFAIPDDVKALAGVALAHRVLLAPAAEIEGLTAMGIIDNIVTSIEAPR